LEELDVKQVMYQQGRAIVEEVPAPVLEAGMLLVAVEYSCISSGTEMRGLRASGVPLWRRAWKNRHLVRQALQYAAGQGVLKTVRRIQEQAYNPRPLGYAASGVVSEVFSGETRFQVGDRVACGGSGYAYHSEFIRVPVNLAVPVPADVSLAHASTATLGAIALQGVRRASPTMGETFVVVGLGILGQLVTQLLRAHGCRVIGADTDPARVQLALQLGMHGALPDQTGSPESVLRMTGGIGADGVIVTAATADHGLISQAFGMCRRKGRVVLVGDVGLNLQRQDMYEKELDFLISTSYGPGRYDQKYEEHGIDYPIGYVRWTENRNLEEYLKLVAEQRVRLEPLISRIVPLEESPEAYAEIREGKQRPMIVLVQYPRREARPSRRTEIRPEKIVAAGNDRVRLALIGPGRFAQTTHLPNLKALARQFELRAIAGRRGDAAMVAAKNYGAQYATTDLEALFGVLIATRHDQHAQLVLRALQAGKHVFVEKPLALTAAELKAIEAFYAETAGDASCPLLMTGFNRRFSPLIERLRRPLQDRSNPLMINYVMNAGYLPPDHWTQQAQGGGRNRGEACHIYDLFTHLTGSRVLDVTVAAIRPATDYYLRQDNFVAMVRFEDGSLATLTYTALGHAAHPKECMQVFVDGQVFAMEDYRRLTAAGGRLGARRLVRDKGHLAELQAFADSIQRGGAWPIPLWQQVQATQIALRVEQFLMQESMPCAVSAA
jgi:predicted dehydrogenase/threonine dehydrogenase-like Zn-dependent dehydrogenase